MWKYFIYVYKHLKEWILRAVYNSLRAKGQDKRADGEVVGGGPDCR